MTLTTSSFGDVVKHLERVAKGDGKTEGDLFEALMRSFLKTDELYRDRFRNVWLWMEYPERNGRGDFGVDIVAEEQDGGLCAIQCKFYPHTKLTKSHIDSFLEAGSRDEFDSMLLIYSGDGYGAKVEDALKGHGCRILDFMALAGSNMDWPNLAKGLTEVRQKPKYGLRDDQKDAVRDVKRGLESTDRGRMIMACGTGKTLVSLRLAEDMIGKGGLVLYAVPSISLMHQAIRYWSEQKRIPHSYVGVCSDPKVSHRTGREDTPDISISEMEIRVTTDPDKIAKSLKKTAGKLTVVFSTYQSMKAIVKAQEKAGTAFDLILCDEAHRTAGIEQGSMEDMSPFMLVHDEVDTKKRLYMTATPKIYGSAVRTKVARNDARPYSMDDESKFGPLLYEMGFAAAIDRGLLSDYKVVVLGVDERYGGRALQNMINTTTESGDINLTDAARMLGLYRILNEPDQDIDMPPLQTAIVYTNRVRDSKSFANTFDKLAMQVSDEGGLRCSATHVDGTQNASVRASALQHLRDSASDPGECRILSNAKCLSEGVDVPTLDAVCFMNPKSSKVGIVQAVGRVMRKVDGKDYGYVILPIGIPPNEKAETILDNHNVFDMVWNVLNAMRSHDANMDVEVNTADLRKKMIDKVKVFGVDREGKIRKAGDDPKTYPLGELDVNADALYAKIVEEVGDRRYLEYWAKDVATVVARLQERIGLAITNNTARKKFDLFMKGLRDIINDSITESDGIDMLAQHMVTRRIFDALFGSDDFTKQNPMSAVLDDTVGELQRHGLESEMKDIEGFYASIENRVAGLDTHDARQPVIAELYGKFFKKAFPKMADRLGIVYTPPEIVDFILRSVDHVLRENFGRGLTDKNINIIDPFTGAGTFLARLMSPELGLIQDRDIKRKYKSEMYANEIVLLAYYIAAVNCESAYGYKTGSFKPFSGVSLTDTFNPGNMDEYAGDVMTGPKERIRRQRESPITVIMANPPYSVGQGNANKDNRNTSHPMLEGRLRETYVKRAPKGNKVSLYNSYIKAFRWASDRIGESGVIGFVTPASFITGNAEAGVRACLYGEFTDIWCFNLRGDVKNKDTWKKEGGKIFGSGSKEPIGITILVKNPTKRGCTIHYKQVDDYLTQGEKLDVVRNVGSIMGIEGWEDVFPDKHHYWINQPGLAGEEFERHMCMGSKEVKRGKSVEAMFGTYSRGAATSRDDWVYNTSENELEVNMRRHIDYCNSQDPDNFIINPKQAKSNTSLTERMKRLKNIMFDKHQIRTSLYRPFFKQWLYFDNTFVESKYRIPSFFPSNTSKNLAIMIPDKIKGKFSTFMTNTTPDLHIHEASQCFPIKAKSDIGKKLTPFVTTRNPLRTHSEPTQPDNNSTRQDQGRVFGIHNERDAGFGSGASRPMLSDEGDGMKDNITDWALQQYQTAYKDNTITKEDIFYYTYGILHHTGYRGKYQIVLVRGLPRIPMAPDFWAFSDAGKRLADLHLGYETCPRYDLGQPLNKIPDGPRAIKFGRKPDPDNVAKTIDDESVLFINGIKVYDNIPAISYKVNGRTPIGWFEDRYKFSTHKESGITNYPLEDVSGDDIRGIIERLVHVGVESDKIMVGLAKKEFESGKDWQPAKTGMDAHMQSGAFQSTL